MLGEVLRATGRASALGELRVREDFLEEELFKLSPEREYDLALRREGRKWKGGSLRRYPRTPHISCQYSQPLKPFFPCFGLI